MKPPKDGTVFIAQFRNYPISLATMWNGASEEWITATPHVEPYKGIWNDWYFENESFSEEELESWMPMQMIIN